MLFTVTEASAAALKSSLRQHFADVDSSHLSEALARGLGFGTAAGMATSLVDGESTPRPLNERAFAARLIKLGYKAPKCSLIDAMLSYPPLVDELIPEDHAEGVLHAVALEVHHQAAKLRLAGGGLNAKKAKGFSMNVRHEGGNEFECNSAFCEDCQMTIMFCDGGNDELVARLVAGDGTAIREIADAYDRDWIEDYVSETDAELMQGKPAISPDICLFGKTVSVWPGAVVIKSHDSIGNQTGIKVIKISLEDFKEIESAVDDIDYNDDAAQVSAILRLVQSPEHY